NEPNDLPPADSFPVATGNAPSGANVIGNILNSSGHNVARAVPATSRPFPVSHLEEGRLLQKIQPIYPEIAKRLRIQGDVLLTALIARDGSIEGLRAISGHPILIPAAIQAVSQWR